MSLLGKISGISNKIERAQSYLDNREYNKAMDILDLTNAQILMCPKEEFIIIQFIWARCFDGLGSYSSAIRCMDQIINYPGFNHEYISKAERYKKELQNR